jgi:hypothetical protein
MAQPRGCPAEEEAAFLKLAGLPFTPRIWAMDDGVAVTDRLAVIDNVGQLAARCRGRVEDVPLGWRSPDAPTGCDHIVTYARLLSTARGGLAGMCC